MKRSILLCAVLVAACGPGADDENAGTPPEQPAVEKGATMPADTALEGTPVGGVVPAVEERVNQAEDAMAERARQAEEQARQAETGTSQP
jgi:hypothetical protein